MEIKFITWVLGGKEPYSTVIINICVAFRSITSFIQEFRVGKFYLGKRRTGLSLNPPLKSYGVSASEMLHLTGSGPN